MKRGWGKRRKLRVSHTQLPNAKMKKKCSIWFRRNVCISRFWSRIKMKLSDKKALELTDCGVYRVTSLLAALAHATKQGKTCLRLTNIGIDRDCYIS